MDKDITLLTLKQKKIYEYIKDYISKHKKSPYIREIQEGCKIKFYKSVVDKLISLEKKGFIKRELNKHRSIKLQEAAPDGEEGVAEVTT